MTQDILTATVPDWAIIPFLTVGGGGAGLMVLCSWLGLRTLGAPDRTYRRWSGPLETGVWVGAFFVVVAVLAAIVAALEGP